MDKEYTLRLREIRKAKQLTQDDLASKIGTTKRIVGSWEREEAAMSLSDAVDCAKALGCTPNDLCGWDEGGDVSAPEAACRPDDPLKRQVVDAYDSMTQAGRESLAGVAKGLSALPENRPGDARDRLPSQNVA